MLRGVRTGLPLPRDFPGALADFTPAVDIVEKDKEYLVKAQLPGVGKDDVKVEFLNGVLTITGERKYPEDVLAETIAADYKDGILAVHLPKTDIKKPATKTIKVN